MNDLINAIQYSSVALYDRQIATFSHNGATMICNFPLFSHGKMDKETALYNLMSDVSDLLEGRTFEDVADEMGFEYDDEIGRAIFAKTEARLNELKTLFSDAELQQLKAWADE